MKPTLEQASVGAAIVGIVLIAFGGICSVCGARVNTSRSIPLGLYWTSSAPLSKGAYVLFCPPQRDVIAEAKKRGYLTAGICPGSYGYMMKRIVAVGKDIVTVSGAGVSVNGQLLPFSVPLSTDRAGRPLARYPAARFVIARSNVLLMTDVSSSSFDARYFGPVDLAQIKTVIVPVFTW